MKKILAVIVALAAGALVFSKVRSSREDNDLWHEATTS
ncbi:MULTISPECIES: DLW-39 family protein [unclassified Pseudonocardia]|nr:MULTISPECIES: DLW-39 family protein [unclassified Pseudonocardia]